MAVTITRDHLAVALRLAATRADAASLPEGQLEILTRLFDTAAALVTKPTRRSRRDEALNEALVTRCAAYLYDSGPGGPMRTARSPLTLHSGAAAHSRAVPASIVSSGPAVRPRFRDSA